MKKKASIIGNYGATNLGDEAILQGILSLHPEIDFTVFSHNPLSTQKTHNTKAVYPLPFGFRSFLRGNFKKSFQILKNSDFVVIGGGGLLTDEKFRAILIWGWHFLWAKIFHKPVFFYANSIGPLNSKFAKFLCQKMFAKSEFITIRDESSAHILEKLEIKNFKITADPAFLISIEKTPKKQKNKKIAISLRNWIKHEEKYINVLQKTILTLEKKGYQVLLISMQTFQDDDTMILQKIKTPNSLIIIPKNLNEVIDLIQNCQFTIGMRLHFLIASALANVPFITLSYSQKTNSLAKNLQQTDFLLPIAEIETKKLEKLIREIEKKQISIKTILKEKTVLERKKSQKNKRIFGIKKNYAMI